MIKPNCRERFTAEDFDFMVRTLARSEKDSVSLGALLTEEDTRDTLLDNPRLFAAVLEQGAPLRISPQFYFYLLTRHVLKETGLADRELADYVAALLEKFSRTAGLQAPGAGAPGPVGYLSDMLVALEKASPHQSFLLRAHMGNYALFITGIFHERVVSRAQHRGAPDLSFYEGMGRASFAAVARHEVARSCALTRVFDSLASEFRGVRRALNRLADSLVHLDAAPGRVPALN